MLEHLINHPEFSNELCEKLEDPKNAELVIKALCIALQIPKFWIVMVSGNWHDGFRGYTHPFIQKSDSEGVNENGWYFIRDPWDFEKKTFVALTAKRGVEFLFKNGSFGTIRILPTKEEAREWETQETKRLNDYRSRPRN